MVRFGFKILRDVSREGLFLLLLHGGHSGCCPPITPASGVELDHLPFYLQGVFRVDLVPPMVPEPGSRDVHSHGQRVHHHGSKGEFLTSDARDLQPDAWLGDFPKDSELGVLPGRP